MKKRVFDRHGEWDLCRCRCEAIARKSGYPVPRKSACVFCPYGSRGDWQTFARELPGQFRKIVALEKSKLGRPTKRGIRMSIMGYRKLVDTYPAKPKRGRDYAAPSLQEYVSKPYRPLAIACPVCGQMPRATKATGCGFLED